MVVPNNEDQYHNYPIYTNGQRECNLREPYDLNPIRIYSPINGENY